MILGVLLLTVTIHRTFNDLFDSVYGRTDLVVSGWAATPCRHSTLGEVRRTPEVDEAEGVVFSVFTLVDRSGEASTDAAQQLNVAGESTRAAGLSDARTVAGRRPSARARDRPRSTAGPTPTGSSSATACGWRPPPASSGCAWWACSSSRPGSTSAARASPRCRSAPARRVMDRPRVWDEVDLVVAGGEETIARVQDDLRRRLPEGVEVADAGRKERRRRVAAPGLQRDPLLLRRDGPVRRRLSDLQLLQHDRPPADAGDRHAAHPRGAGAGGSPARCSARRPAGRPRAPRSGSASASCWRSGLIELMRALDFPVGELAFSAFAPVAALATGLHHRRPRRPLPGAPRRPHVADQGGARHRGAPGEAEARAAPLPARS